MRKSIIAAAIGAGALVLLAVSCSSRHSDVVIQQPAPMMAPAVVAAPAPVIIQQQDSFGSSFMGSMAGTAMGHMLFGGYHRAPSIVSSPTIVHQTTIINKSVTAPAPAPVSKPSIGSAYSQAYSASRPVSRPSIGSSYSSARSSSFRSSGGFRRR